MSVLTTAEKTACTSLATCRRCRRGWRSTTACCSFCGLGVLQWVRRTLRRPARVGSPLKPCRPSRVGSANADALVGPQRRQAATFLMCRNISCSRAHGNQIQLIPSRAVNLFGASSQRDCRRAGPCVYYIHLPVPFHRLNGYGQVTFRPYAE